MCSYHKWYISKEMKEKLINELTPELNTLRKKADIRQGELANLIGISRQTYSAIERKARKMTWNTYLSLILFFDYNVKTHSMIRSMGAFPYEMILRFNDGKEVDNIDTGILFGGSIKPCLDCLDEQALSSIKTLIMIEYSRCTDTPVDQVVKCFDNSKVIK